MSAPRGRRTQEQRRSDTIAKLIEATIDTIADLGYHRTSLGEISARAGTSRGGLFRHFASRLDLVVAAAEEVGRRHVERFLTLRDAGVVPALPDAIGFARDAVRDRINSVWFELLVAARTDPELRERLAPVAKALLDETERLGQEIAAERGLPAEQTQLMVTSLIHMFDGEAIFRVTYPRPELEAKRLQAATELVDLVARRSQRQPS